METTTSRDGKPRLDEATFQKLLAAAYVIQEHHAQAQSAAANRPDNGHADAEYATTLAEIVEVQHQILLRHLDLDGAAGMVVEEMQKITSASGAAVCLLNHDHLVYRAAKGMTAAEMGQGLPRDESLSATVLSQGVVLRCADTLTDSQVNPVLAARVGIGSLVAVPIFHDDQVAGVLELNFRKPHGYQEQDVRTCQLMAGLVTEVLTRTASEQWKKNLTAERDSMLEALEKLKPQLDRLAKDAQASTSSRAPERVKAAPPAEPAKHESVIKLSAPANVTKTEPAGGGNTERCPRCGHEVAPQEVYCGNCGSLRSDRARTETGQARPSSAWDMGEEHSDSKPFLSGASEKPRASFSTNIVDHEVQLPHEVLALTKDEREEAPQTDIGDELMKLLPPDPDGPGLAPIERAASPLPPAPSPVEAQPAPSPGKAPDAYPWTSAANAREWLNSMAGEGTSSGLASLLKTHRGDLSLGAAIFALLIALFWGMSNHGGNPASSAAATTNVAPPAETQPAETTNAPSAPSAAQGAAPVKQRRKAAEAQPELSLTERALVALGLAEAPPPPIQYQGNPDVTVWVDLHTALYYCPGSELYGRTAKGKYVSQRAAQIDQFEPASRKVCE